MTSRPFSVIFAAVLLAIIAVSGVGAGGELLVFAAGLAAGAVIGGGIVAYGLACLAAAIGVFQLRRWGWWLAVGLILVGLAIQLWIVLMGASLDSVSLVGLVVWGLTLVLLLVPSTRNAIRS